jgi:hypothetical protein
VRPKSKRFFEGIPPSLSGKLSPRAQAFVTEDEPCGDGRTVTFDRSPRRVTRGGTTYTLVGGFDMVVWLVDAEGKVIEVDDLGVSFYAADSLAQRMEQLALERERPPGVPSVHTGRVGAALAKARGLVLVGEAKDSGHCTWMQREGEPPCQVVESFEPTEHGATERVWRTYVYEPRGTTQKAPKRASPKTPKPVTRKTPKRAIDKTPKRASKEAPKRAGRKA